MFNKRTAFLFLFISLLLLSYSGFTQIKISAIQIEGNAKTKSYIIARELPYRVGDVVANDSLSLLNMPKPSILR